MKVRSLLLSTFALLLLCSGVTLSQNYRNALTLNPFGLFIGTLNAQYENALSGENSFTVRASAIMRTISSHDVSAFGLGGSYRWYLPPNRAITGIWVGPSADLLFLKWKYSRGDVSSTFFNIGGEIGYKWIFEQYVVEPYLSLGLSLGKVESEDGKSLAYGNGIIYSVGLSLGYSW